MSAAAYYNKVHVSFSTDDSLQLVQIQDAITKADCECTVVHSGQTEAWFEVWSEKCAAADVIIVMFLAGYKARFSEPLRQEASFIIECHANGTPVYVFGEEHDPSQIRANLQDGASHMGAFNTWKDFVQGGYRSYVAAEESSGGSGPDKTEGQELTNGESYKLFDHNEATGSGWLMFDSGGWLTKTNSKSRAWTFSDYNYKGELYIKTHDGYFGSDWNKGVGNYSWQNATSYSWSNHGAAGDHTLILTATSHKSAGQKLGFRDVSSGKPFYYSCSDYATAQLQKFAC